MAARCKFRCSAVTKLPLDAFHVELEAVVSGSEENKSFFRWTPSGSLKFSSINASAAEQFVPGAEYYIDITPAVIA